MRIVITGALGHIGSHLIRSFPTSMQSVELVLLDNLSTQRFPSLFNLPENGRFRFWEFDVTKDDFHTVLPGADAVVHLAAITDAATSVDHPERVRDNNLVGTERVALACMRYEIPLLAVSTTSVYGTQASLVDEECSEGELAPQSPYAEVKLHEERLVRSLCGEGLRATVLRLGTIFGPSVGMRFHTAVNKFCWQAVMGQELTVWKTAYEQKRPYLDLTDAGRMFAFLITQEIFDGRIYNVVTLNATVRDIVGAVTACVPETSVAFTDSPLMNQLSYEVSRRRSEAIGFTYQGDLLDGVQRTVDLLRRANSAN